MNQDKTNDKQHQERQQAEREADQDAALYGTPGKGEYATGDVISFRDPATKKKLSGKVLFVRAPGEAVRGGRVHPTVYMCYVEGEAFPRAVYPGDIVQDA